jgi:hypothetical protein
MAPTAIGVPLALGPVLALAPVLADVPVAALLELADDEHPAAASAARASAPTTATADLGPAGLRLVERRVIFASFLPGTGPVPGG